MEKIWLKTYPPGVPETIDPDPYPSITSLLSESFERYADHSAFKNFGHSVTYRTLWEKSTQLAAYFQNDLKLTKGDRLAIMLPNILQYPITLLAALQAGLTVVNINPLYTERELLFPLKDSGAKGIVVLANFASTLSQVLTKTDLKHVIVTEVGDELPWSKRTLINYYLKYIKRHVKPAKIDQKINYRDAMAKGKDLTLIPLNIKPDDLAFLQYTGGTTGIPKGSMLTHRNMVANILQSITWISGFLEKGKEVAVAALPLYHIFSLTICCFAFLQLGAEGLLITNPRDINGLIKDLVQNHFTVFVGVNTLYQALLFNSKLKTVDFNQMKLALAGGMSVIHKVADRWQKATGKPIIMGYGLTEASPVVSINPLSVKEFTGSIGLPVPSTDIAILDEQGNEVPIGGEGELCVKGPQVMAGYWHQPEETALVLNESGWLRTGDLASMDEKGYIYLIDRKKDMILVSGFNVYPNEVEDVIASHPGVAEVAVVGVYNDISGEMVKAFIVKKDPNLTKQEIKQFCKQRLTGYKRPRIIEFRADLPKSNVGKVLRKDLRETN